jgi:hypothetical protein
MVDDLDDGSEAAGVGSFLDEEDTTDLDEAPFARDNCSFTHIDDLHRKWLG